MRKSCGYGLAKVIYIPPLQTIVEDKTLTSQKINKNSDVKFYESVKITKISL